MSVLSCSYCGQWIDTDDDPPAYIREDTTEDGRKRDIWACEGCREEYELGEFENEDQ